MGFSDMTATIGLDQKPYLDGLKNAETAAGKFSKRVEAESRKAGAGLFARHERANLASQGIDIASGLATGQRPLTIFLQQGGQVADLLSRRNGGLVQGFKDLGTSALGMVSKLGPVGAVVAAVGAALAGLGYGFYKVSEAEGEMEAALFRLEKFNEKRRESLFVENDRQLKAQIVNAEKYDEIRKHIINGRLGQASSLLNFDGDIREAKKEAILSIAQTESTKFAALREEEKRKVENSYKDGTIAFAEYQRELLRISEARYEEDRKRADEQIEETKRQARETSRETERIKLEAVVSGLYAAQSVRAITHGAEIDEINRRRPDVTKGIFRPDTDGLSSVGGHSFAIGRGKFDNSVERVIRELGPKLDAITATIDRGVGIHSDDRNNY